MSRLCDIDDVLDLFGCSDNDIDAKCTIEEAIQANEVSSIKTKQIKYYDEDEKVWKIGEVIVDGEREGE